MSGLSHSKYCTSSLRASMQNMESNNPDKTIPSVSTSSSDILGSTKVKKKFEHYIGKEKPFCSDVISKKKLIKNASLGSVRELKFNNTSFMLIRVEEGYDLLRKDYIVKIKRPMILKNKECLSSSKKKKLPKKALEKTTNLGNVQESTKEDIGYEQKTENAKFEKNSEKNLPLTKKNIKN